VKTMRVILMLAVPLPVAVAQTTGTVMTATDQHQVWQADVYNDLWGPETRGKLRC
jgi:Ni/Fe-hydrogenase subunit HybB-like protein